MGANLSAKHHRRAAQYVRMSTEHQRYSIEYQTTANLAYAAEHGYDLVRTYADAGISGLTLRRREGLKSLLADVLGGDPGFDVVLIYDVSRWGRFQDVDQGAHYEYLCRAAGVGIEYTAEPFANDASLAASILKSLKRAMAAEYSRDLSVRISRAQMGMAALGYWMGGPAPYGLSRVPISPDGQAGRPYAAGEHKALRDHRTRLAPGPPHEVEVVRRIFRLYVTHGLRMDAIAALLNAERVPHRPSPDWSRERVRRVLTNVALCGTHVCGRSHSRLHERVPARRAEWTLVRGAFEAVVTPELFALAKRQMRVVHPHCSDDVLLAELRQVLSREGRLSRDVIDAAPDCHCATIYAKRFGGLVQAYARIGYTPSGRQLKAAARATLAAPWRRRTFPQRSDEQLLDDLRTLLTRTGRLSVDLINSDPDTGHCETYRRRFGSMRQVYDLVGYTPNPHQERIMAARPRRRTPIADARSP